MPFSILGLLMVTTQLPFGLSPPSHGVPDPMFAGSPQRELWRAWDKCVTGVEAVMQMNGRGQQEALNFVFSACDEEESQLTGAMVNRFGYSRGSAAVRHAREGIASRIKKEFKEELDLSPVAGLLQIVDGWQVFRASGECQALKIETLAPYYTSTLLIAEGSQRAIQFQMTPSDAAKAAGVDNKRAKMRVVMIAPSRIEDAFGDPVFLVKFNGKNLVTFTTLLTPGLAAALGGADRVDLRDPAKDQTLGPTYPVSGISSAIAGINRCLQQNP